MILFTHAIVGGAIATALPNHPVLAVVVSFASHFLLDAIPHWDYDILSNSANPQSAAKRFVWKDRLFALDLARIGSDAISGLLAVFFLFFAYQPHTAFLAVICAGATILPDFLRFVYRLVPRGWLKSLEHFHEKNHTNIRLADMPVIGIASQVFLVLLVLAGMFYFSFTPHRIPFNLFAYASETEEVGQGDGAEIGKENLTANLATNLTANLVTKSGKPPQFVVMAFDGSKSVDMWKDTRAFAQQMEQSRTPVHFTYFINGVYLLAPENAYRYHGPEHGIGESAIGYGVSLDDIAARVEQMNLARTEGHEIESHANGHFNGADWTLADWKNEFSQFNDLLFHVAENNPGIPATVRYEGKPSEIIGFRAPELGHGDTLYDALPAMGYRYDTSEIGEATAWPKKDAHGVWRFPLAAIPVGDHMTISMDYNFYMHQTGSVDIAKRGDELYQKIHDDTKKAFVEYFEKNYQGNRAPVYMGNHFALWNDGVYWEVMKDFAREVCIKPEVRCVSYGELTDWLDKSAPLGLL